MSRSLDSAGRAEVTCEGCGRTFPTRDDRTAHQNSSPCIVVKEDFDREEIAEVVADADTMYEIQRERGWSRERARNILNGLNLMESRFKPGGPEALLENAGLEIADNDADDGGASA